MNTEQTKEKLLKIVSEVVNSIADNAYEKLGTLVMFHSSWYDEKGDISVAIKEFKNAIESNYSGWAEEEGKEFKIRSFTLENTEDNFDVVSKKLLDEGRSNMCYNLKTIDNDPDYFWLEICFNLISDGNITTTINLNF